MKAESDNQQVNDQNKMTWVGIVSIGVLLLVSLGALIYFFVISN